MYAEGYLALPEVMCMQQRRLLFSAIGIIILFAALAALNSASNRPKPPPDVELQGRLAPPPPPEPEKQTKAEDGKAEEPKAAEPTKDEKTQKTDTPEGSISMTEDEKTLVADAKGSVVKIETDKGDIYLDLYDDKTPVTVGSFLDLVGSGFYDGLKFHRVIPNFMIQGGCPKGTGTGGPGFTIPDEADKGLKHVRGTLAMAKTPAPNTGGSQFYICHSPQAHLDGVHTVFGECIKGLDVVDSIAQGDKMGKVVILKKSDSAESIIEKAKKARVSE